MPELTVSVTPAQPVFYYNLADPHCYLVAERIMSELPVIPEWEPVLASELGLVDGQEVDRELIAQRARELGLQPLRWPARWPPDSSMAILAATYAKGVGRGVAFALAAFRQAFAGGRDLGDEGTVLIAAAACEMHPNAVLKGIELRSVKGALRQAGARALAAGVGSLPAIQVGEELFEGSDCIELADASPRALR